MDLSLPPPSFNTPRCHLRRYQPEDAPALLQLMQDNHDRVAPSFPTSYMSIRNEEQAKAWIDLRSKAFDGDGDLFAFGIWLKEEGTYIGQAMIKNLDRSVRKAELAYYLGKDFEGRGLMWEVMTTLVEACFSEVGLNRLYLRIFTTNKRSKALAERCGFQEEGVLRQDFRTFYGKMEDVTVYSILAEEYLD